MRSGRTSNLIGRQMEHARDPIMKDFSFEAVYRISPKNPRLEGYMRAAEEFLKKEGGGG